MARGKPNKTKQKQIDAALARYYRNREQILQQNRQKRAARTADRIDKDREYQKVYQATYVDPNPDFRKRRKKEYDDRTREVRNANNRAKYAANPDHYRRKNREWARKNPEKVKAKNAASRLNRRAKGGYKLKTAEVLAVFETHGRSCHYCSTAYATDIEHMTPICRGGSNDPSNLVPACKKCNNKKGRLTKEEFLHRLVFDQEFALLLKKSKRKFRSVHTHSSPSSNTFS